MGVPRDDHRGVRSGCARAAERGFARGIPDRCPKPRARGGTTTRSCGRVRRSRRRRLWKAPSGADPRPRSRQESQECRGRPNPPSGGAGRPGLRTVPGLEVDLIAQIRNGEGVATCGDAGTAVRRRRWREGRRRRCGRTCGHRLRKRRKSANPMVGSGLQHARDAVEERVARAVRNRERPRACRLGTEAGRPAFGQVDTRYLDGEHDGGEPLENPGEGARPRPAGRREMRL